MPDFDDDLDRLKAALKGAPAPDAPSKQAAFIVAEENFAKLQEQGGFVRPTETQAKPAGFLKGLSDMFSSKSLKPLLLTTSSLVVIGVGVVLVQNQPPADVAAVEPKLEEVALDGPGDTPDIAGIRAEDDAQQSASAEIVAEPLGQVAKPAPAAPVQKRAAAQPRLQGLADQSDLSGFVGGIAAEQSGVTSATIAPSPAPSDGIILREAPNTDRFANEAPNPLKIASEDPVSTFSTDVDTASYAWVRSALQNGQMPDPASVRVEEMVNYFPYDYAAPDGDAPFATTVSVSETPWNEHTQLVHIGLQGEMPVVEDRPPLNLVFLIDTSGSMNAPDKLPLLIQSFRLMLSELRPQDEVAIVTYAGRAGLVLEPTKASDSAKINAALANLSAGGSTAGAAGLQQAYQVADQMAEDGEIGRVILATDGDFNVGQSSDAEMKTLIEAKRDSGTYLSVLGFGRGNINEALMQTLAQNGNGQAAYIDTLSEARKVLVDQLTGALFPIAGDVKVQVEWNPAQVAEYRLIGYETRALKREDFNNDKVDAGDIGAGLQVTALYEVTPVGSPAVLNDPLRYGEAVAASGSDELGFLRLRYKEPGEDRSKLIEAPIAAGTSTPSTDAQFATAIAGFGQLLRGSDYLAEWGFADAIALANSAKGADSFGYRAEAITLMRLAESLSKSR
ncbi:VWA domain-containing protein [uncultured Litoreibacter sp.]|uniref:vWA domain-containing protein n=1 Tax=uncultured Litoreibacter sp. TaxID=1392394 RepID=UPI002618A1CA|nr:VWA domain-containing protein [uncultured Litoreibacter sp.]